MITHSKEARLACMGGEPTVTIPTPAWPVTGKQEEAWMAEVVRSGKWSWVGAHERAFSESYAEFIGTQYCACLANGTVTLQCALQAVGVVPGDEVIVPGLTWVATAQAAMDVGANVVFVDINSKTLCIDPKAIRAAITPKTKAIIPVHLYGCMCDMDAIMDIAREHKLKVVEDVAHQHGSRWRDRGAGSIGDVGSYSFQQSKILTSGEGGAVTTNSKEIYETIFALKQVGHKPVDAEQNPFEPLMPANRYGHNYRMTEMQAVLLRGGLTRLAEQTATREARAQQITEGLEAIDGPLRAVSRDPRVTRQAYYAMTFTYDAARADGLPREAFIHAAGAEGLPIVGTYPPAYRSPLMNLYDNTSPVPFRDASLVQGYRNLRLPNTERAISETAVVLMHQHLLGSEAYIEALLMAAQKVTDNLSAVKLVWEANQAKQKA